MAVQTTNPTQNTGSTSGSNGWGYPPYGETPKKRGMLSLTIELPDDDTGAQALARADRALADEGLNIVGFSSYGNV